jgi:hypothetical protein
MKEIITVLMEAGENDDVSEITLKLIIISEAHSFM